MSIQPERLINAASMQLSGIDKHYTFQEMDQIPVQWSQFGPRLGAIPGQVGAVGYDLCHNMDTSGFHYMSCAEVSGGFDLPAELATKTLPAQRYAVFRHEDHVSKISETVDAIWQGWLPQSECEVVGDPVMLERYGETFCPDKGIGDVEIWIAIKP